mmetsp:Transcript_71261/g.82902  ORF Transcript_71261/g.82902 Transcript_71261/m.82902 type:complete len:96 (-) Transcript_71261:61-348(-)
MSASDPVQVTVKKWNCVAVWNWNNTQNENCAICKMKLTEPCIECQGDFEQSNKCTISFGQCNHAFHTHCIDQWLKKNQTCPADSQPWITASVREN